MWRKVNEKSLKSGAEETNDRQSVLDDIWENHNHSWYEELYERNKNNANKTAFFFRGTQVAYAEFFNMVENYARALKQFGVNKGDEFVACLRSTPDYPVLVAAASLIGAVINPISAEFNLNYIAEIINNTSAGSHNRFYR